MTRNTIVALVVTTTLIVCLSTSSLAEGLDAGHIHPYPHGAAALPLLREIWDFGTGNIYPRALAGRFESGTRLRLEESLISGDGAALADVLNPFFDGLGVSHTRLYDRRHQGYYLLRSLFSTRDLDSPQLYTIGVQLGDIEPGLIQAVLEGSPAAAAGLRRGDRIATVIDTPFASLLQWQQAGPVRLGVKSESGPRTVTLSPLMQSFHRALANATQASHRRIGCRDRRIAYLHLWAGTNDVFLDSLKAAVADARAEEVDGFVLDLRDGYGGAWWPYLDLFFADRKDYFAFTTLNLDGQSETMRAEPQDNPGAWRGPLAVIINGGTRSGKESLAFQFKQSGRGRLFGTTTKGAFSSGLGAFAERDAGYLLYLAVAELRLNDRVIEGVGVSPDVVVIEAQDRDAPLQAALNHLGCQRGEPV